MLPGLLRLGEWVVAVLLCAAGVILAGAFLTAYFTVHPVRRPPSTLSPGRPGGFRAVRFRSTDGIALAGWYADGGEHDTTIIACHGWPGDKTDMLGLAEVVRRAGFNVLVFDFRGWGESGRGPVTLGYREAHDVLGAVRFLKQSHPALSRRIGVFGLSMGAAAALLAAAQSPDIDAVVADSSYAGLDQGARRVFRQVWGPLAPIVYLPTRWFGERLMGGALLSASPEQAISHIAPRPVLIIHGADDRLVDADDAHVLYRTSGSPKSLWVVVGADHAETRAVGSPEYDSRVIRFFRQHLLGGAPWGAR